SLLFTIAPIILNRWQMLLKKIWLTLITIIFYFRTTEFPNAISKKRTKQENINRSKSKKANIVVRAAGPKRSFAIAHIVMKLPVRWYENCGFPNINTRLRFNRAWESINGCSLLLLTKSRN